MQIVSSGDNLHELLNPEFWENKKKNINLLSTELVQRAVVSFWRKNVHNTG